MIDKPTKEKLFKKLTHPFYAGSKVKALNKDTEITGKIAKFYIDDFAVSKVELYSFLNTFTDIEDFNKYCSINNVTPIAYSKMGVKLGYIKNLILIRGK